METTNGFDQYRLLILNDIKRIGDGLIKLQDIVMSLALSVESLKTTEKIRSIIWGSMGAGIVSIIVFLIKGMKF